MALSPKIVDAITPVLVYALGLVCPTIPNFIWTIIIKAVLNGDLTLDHFEAFLTAHALKTYTAPTDYPEPPPQVLTPNNLTTKQP